MTGQRRAFGVVNANIMRSPSISGTAKALYSLLATYADAEGVCWPSIAVLAEGLGSSESTIHRALGELQDKGVIERTERKRSNGSQTTSVNVLLDWSSVRRGGVTHDTPGGSTSDTPMNKTNEQDHSLARPVVEREKESKAQSTERDRALFAQWWDLYPKKVGKQAALRAYIKAIKTTDPACLLTGLTSQAEALDQRKGEGFCPDPATWINAGRWDDEVTPRQQTHPPRLRDETYAQYEFRTGVKWVGQ